MDVAHHHRLRRMLRDAKRRARARTKKARQMLREYEAPAEDARGAQYTPYEHNVSGLVQMDNVVFQDIVLPHLTAQAAAALRPHVRRVFGAPSPGEQGTYLRAMVPQFRVRWLPGKLRAGHQSEGVLPHCKMKSRDGLGRVTLVNAIYSERLVNIVVDFGWIPRQRRSSRAARPPRPPAPRTDGAGPRRAASGPVAGQTKRRRAAGRSPAASGAVCAALPRRDRRGQRRRNGGQPPGAQRATRGARGAEECAQALAQARGGDAVAARGARREERPAGTLPTRQ